MTQQKVAVISIFTIISVCLTQASLPQKELSSELQCSRSAKCVPIRSDSCFGTNLNYNSVSFDLSGHKNQYNVKAFLEKYEWLKSVPDCYKAIRPFLCAVHFPKCDNDTISKVPHKLCKNARKECGIVSRWGEGTYSQISNKRIGCNKRVSRWNLVLFAYKMFYNQSE